MKQSTKCQAVRAGWRLWAGRCGSPALCLCARSRAENAETSPWACEMPASEHV